MDSELKIAIGTEAFPPTIDGISTVAKCYADIINEKLGEAVIVTPKNPNQEDYKYKYKIYRYKSLFTFGEGYPVGWPFKRQFSEDIINMNFDVLHSHCPIATSYFYRRVNRIKRIPQVLTYHTKYEYDFESRIPGYPLRHRAYGFLLNNIKSADEVWVTSKGTAQSLRKVGYEGDYIIMPNGCDLPISSFSDDDRDIIRRKHSIPAIKKYIRKNGLDGNVIFTGQILDRGELQLYYSAADLLVFPSVFDTNGLVVREAAASATAALLVDGSCAAEGIKDGETGFLCSEDDQSVAASILKIFENPPQLRQVGINAQNDIYISWDESIKNAYERYHIVIDDFYSKGKDKQPYIY